MVILIKQQILGRRSRGHVGIRVLIVNDVLGRFHQKVQICIKKGERMRKNAGSNIGKFAYRALVDNGVFQLGVPTIKSPKNVVERCTLVFVSQRTRKNRQGVLPCFRLPIPCTQGNKV